MTSLRSGRDSADLIVSGRIATLAGSHGFGWVEAIAVAGGRIVAAGTLPDLEGLAGTGTLRWRLGPGVVLTPSVTDAHLHLGLAALAADQPDLTGLDLDGAKEIIGAAHRRLLEQGDGTGWLLGHGWSFDALRARPTSKVLDAAAPGRPVALWAHDHHSRWVSARTVALAGLGERSDPAGGRIERDEAGTPTGLLFEHAAGLVDAIIPGPEETAVSTAIVAYARDLARLGVTSVHDPGGVAPDPDLRGGPTLYRSLAAADQLPLRVVASIREEQLERAIETGFRSGRAEVVDTARGPGTTARGRGTTARGPDGPARGRYRDGWLKLFSDGALGSRTAALLEPYEAGDPAGPAPGGPTGLPLHDGRELSALAGRAVKAGIASQIHAIGDAAVRTVLDVLAGLPAVPGAWHRVEHAQLVDAADIGRFAVLGVAASVQPSHLLSDASAVRAAWGARSASAFPLADLERAGTLLPFGTDAPVEPPDPWPGLAAAVTRRGASWPEEAALHPEQSLTLARALRGACLDGPRSANLHDQGHLGVGARADLVVLPGGPFEAAEKTVPGGPNAEDLSGLHPLLTVLDGEVVWCAPGFDPQSGAA